MADKNLNDDMVKLVEYTIVNIDRSNYRIICSGHELFDENMSGDAFASWVISQNSDTIAKELGKKDYDSKYLRVYYNVQERWARLDLKYEERQLDILEKIEKKMK